MSKRILFCADASGTSRHAATAAIEMALKTKSEISAQFVVEDLRIPELEAFRGEPGLCGSGILIDTTRQITQALTNLGETLLMYFCALAEGRGLSVDRFIDMGDRTKHIAKRAEGCWLIVSAGGDTLSDCDRDVLHAMSCPLLSVQSEGKAVLYVPTSMYDEMMPRLRPLLRELTMTVNILEVEYPKAASAK